MKLFKMLLNFMAHDSNSGDEDSKALRAYKMAVTKALPELCKCYREAHDEIDARYFKAKIEELVGK